MISDPNFRGITEQSALPGKVSLSEHWRFELKETGSKTRGSATREPLGGLRVAWDGPTKRVRLFQTLEIDPALVGVDVDIDIAMCFETEASHPRLVQWIAILKETPEGERFHALLNVFGQQEPDGWVITGRYSGVKFESEHYLLGVQFNGEPKEFLLRSVRGRIERHVPDADTQAEPLAAVEPDLPLVRQQEPLDFEQSPEWADTAGNDPPEAEAGGLFRRLFAKIVPDDRSSKQVVSKQSTQPKIKEPNAKPAPSAAKPTQKPASKPATAPAPAARPASVRSGRQKAVVIAWDMTHNPVGRAYLLADMLAKDYDVTLVGPMFKRYGSAVWPPLKSSGIEHRSFPAESLTDFVKSAKAFVEGIEADLVVACKARMPSVLLGLLLKYKLGCTLLLDVDDHELSFFDDAPALSFREARTVFSSEPEQAEQPFGEVWTRLIETIVRTFDDKIVSNPALQKRFGGVIVRHARDERIFGPKKRSRDRVRREFGYTDDDRVILFLGTPRKHKGVFRIADALRRVERDNLALCVIGDPKDKSIAAQLAAYKDARVRVFPDQPWERLPELIRMADGVCLLQAEDSPIAQYQIPAKLTDALATGVPVAATRVPPFADIPAGVITEVKSDEDLDAFIKRIADDSIPADFAERASDYFIGELSYAANRARLTALAERSRKQPERWPRAWSDLLALIGELSGVDLPTATPAWSETRKTFPAITRDRPFDIAFFWKQNDTGIYGRRHDMMLKYLSAHPRVGRIIQFDAPLDIRRLSAMARSDPDAYLDQANLVVEQTIRRFLKAADSNKIARRVFVHRGSRADESFLGQDLPRYEDYVGWVRSEIEAAGFHGPLVGWVTPSVVDFPVIYDEMNFSLSVADLIDDQRAFPASASHLRTIIDGYRETLQRVDVVLSNCEATQVAFGQYRKDIHVIPNAAEPQFAAASDQPPEALAALEGPIVGYVGNLRDRVDVDLLERLASHNPAWQIVLIGSAHRDPEVLRLRDLPNVHFLGVVPYAGLPDYISHFDVAIMPHLDNDISKAMNPLKLYVYAAAGVPIVTTRVANIGEVSGYAEVADTPEEFVAAVEKQIASPRQPRPLEAGLTWPSRVEQAVELIDTAATGQVGKPVASETAAPPDPVRARRKQAIGMDPS